MIGNLWNNIAQGTRILIASADSGAHLQCVDTRIVYNRGELIGMILGLLTKVANPGTGKTATLNYAFSNKTGRTVAELQYSKAQQVLTLADAVAGTYREYAVQFLYQGGQYLYFWFDADAFTDPTAQLEVDATILAKTMD